MKEYIERSTLLAIIFAKFNEHYGKSREQAIHDFYRFVTKKICVAPAADVVEVRHARWNGDGRCTNCGGHAPFMAMADEYYESPYCFECGALMDKEE